MLIEGDVLERLRAGRSVEVEFAVSVLSGRDGRLAAETRQTFRLSYDLWEERFAATRIDKPPRSVSHLTARDLEVWCLDNLTISRAAVEKTLGQDRRFWIKIEHKALDDGSDASADDDGPFTLRTLVDALSRKAGSSGRPRVLEAGPFSLSD